MRPHQASLFLLAVSAPSLALAQTATPAPRPSPARPSPSDDANSDEPDIIVRGTRNLPGAVVGDIPPEQQLGPADIRSYGVSSIADLLTELAPQTRSGRGSGGAPIVLLNGHRISGFQEIRNLPTEAIARVDILPEEVALKYGYRADQRVVNIVLRRRFRAVTAELEGRIATAGGRATPQIEADLVNIKRDGRFSLHLEYAESSALTEAERTIALQASPFSVGGNIVGATGGEIDPALSASAGSVVTIAGVPATAAQRSPTLADFRATAGQGSVTDPRPYRTLLAANRDFTANATYAHPIFDSVQATINGRVEINSSRGQQGLPTASLLVPAGNPFSPFSRDVLVDRAFVDGIDPIRQHVRAIDGHVGTTLAGDIGKWRWTVTGQFDIGDSSTETDAGIDAAGFQARLRANDPTANPFGPLLPGQIGVLAPNRAHSTSTDLGFDALFNGPVFDLPAGPISAALRVGADTIGFDSRSVRGGVVQSANLSRGTVNGQANFDFPLTSRTKGVLGAVGNLSANFNYAIDRYSDFGALTTLGYGANWSPIEPIRIIASFTQQDDAPSQQQLGNPTVTTPNVRVFDYVRGQNATITLLTGGNPALIADNRQTKKLGLTIKPWKDKDFTLTANYVEARTDNPIAAFPSATAAIEAAFPQRFLRDAGGQLLRIDSRPINFARTSRSEFRWGFDFSKPIKSSLQKKIEAFRAGTGPNPFPDLLPKDGKIPQSTFGGSIFGSLSEGRGPGSGANRRGGGQAAPATQGTPGAAPSPPADGQSAPPAPAPGGFGGAGGGRPGGGFGGGRGGFGGGGFGGGGGRLQFALYHTWHLTDRVLVQANGPSLDLLNGDTIGSGGGQPRHEIEAQAGYANNGIGARFAANWESATRVDGTAVGTAQSLRFSDLATVNLRLFADFSQRIDLVKDRPWLRGVRVVVSLDNIFDAKRRVTDAAGITPVSYQPDYLNPLGRSVRISIRKLFL